MLRRPTSGSVVCPGCGRLVGVRDERCLTCGRRNPGMWGFAPMLGQLGRSLGFLEIILGGCTALYLVTLFYDPDAIGMRGIFSFLAPGTEALRKFGMSGAVPVYFEGRWWTLLSAAWLHGSALHIFFNLLWIRQLVPAMSEIFGTGRLIVVYTLSSITGFLLTSTLGLFPFLGFLQGAYFTIGASAPLFGLFGALVFYGQRVGQRALVRQMMNYAIFWIILGFVSGFGIDNWAHVGGFVGGYLAARWLDPVHPENPRHQVAALFCLLLTVLSIVLSLVVPLRVDLPGG